jgi:hypothetical protein
MHSRPGQKYTKLVSLFQSALNRIDLLLVLKSLLLLLSLDNPILQHVHDLKELIKCQLGLVLQLLSDQELLSFLGIPT